MFNGRGKKETAKLQTNHYWGDVTEDTKCICDIDKEDWDWSLANAVGSIAVLCPYL